ncbi:hypothetical protein ACFFJY_19280 [Fictibacillus aquaticus]|uniref:Uncharacterized protein n=1 Tax=Fictibacillus aquaticus TaxID=2021314 RepID=A0A235F5T3_9BACL|nr:hypothetical protein [Fictibacillus aquaticus]OYD56287.1 hypothetical protein CGZ90_18220 [Fictibacillus aquaticus]
MAKMYKLSSRAADKTGLVYASQIPANAGSVVKNADEQELFSEILMDSHKNYWFAKQSEEGSLSYKLFIFDHHKGVLKSHPIQGQPNFYEFDSCVVVACEGDGSKGSVLVFSKNEPELIKEWKVNGFLWEVEMEGDNLFISTYIAEENQAVLYIIADGKKKRVNLGSNFAPTDILCVNGRIHISCAPVLSGDPKKIMVLNCKGKLVSEHKLSISPRTIYQVGDEIMIYELDLATGKSEKIVYLNIETGEQKEHTIPHSQVVECTGQSLSLIQPDSNTLFTWDHSNRKIVESRKVI